MKETYLGTYTMLHTYASLRRTLQTSIKEFWDCFFVSWRFEVSTII